MAAIIFLVVGISPWTISLMELLAPTVSVFTGFLKVEHNTIILGID
jgi:hypothetical protein